MTSYTRTPHIRYAHGIRYCGSKHPAIKKLEESTPPTCFGSKVWRSSFMMMQYLIENPLDQRTRVMEIGCGWGLLGIFCAKSFNCPVLLTDKDERVFSYAKTHLSLNDVHADFAVLGFQDIKPEQFQKRDLIIGSDICFWPELVGSLKKLIGNAMSSGVRQVIIADPGRYPFMQVAKYCQLHYCTQLLIRETKNRKEKGYLLIITNKTKNLAA